MAQPIVKYTLNKKGQVPEWINTSNSSFAGQHGITGNKTGYIPKYESPQDTIFLGIASGDPDPDGTPDDYVGIITTKALLQSYITATGSTLQYKTTTDTISGLAITTTTTTYTTSFTYTDVTSNSSTSTSETTTDGVTTRTDTVTTTERTNYETSYDYAAEATRRWDIYTALNS